MEPLGFFFYLSFIISWFLRLTVRFPFLGSIRLDLLLIILIFFIYLISVDKKNLKGLTNPCYTRLLFFVVLILVITPLAEWPGSVIHHGLKNYVKAIVFFFFTVWFVQTEKRLRIFISVFLACQIFRVLEPLYLHFTQGYWGDSAYMGYDQSMNRLAGSPYDVINPNGLAFVVLIILPFIIQFYSENIRWKLIAAVVVPTSLYALYLTGSRSGMLGLMSIMLMVIMKSKHKIVLSILVVGVTLFAIANGSANLQDRYLSIISQETANAGTVIGRLEGLKEDFMVGLRKPLFGHGLGTSLEANVHYRGINQLSHNLYLETFQELGIVGLVVFISYIYQIFKNINSPIVTNRSSFMLNLQTSLFIATIMSIIFSFASYGLSGYLWYFLGGLSLVVSELTKENVNA